MKMNILSISTAEDFSSPRPNKVVVITISDQKYENSDDLDLTMMTVAATMITILMMATTTMTLITLMTMTMMKNTTMTLMTTNLMERNWLQ